MPSLRECVLKCNFFNVIPRKRELKISAAQFPQHPCGKWAWLKEIPPLLNVKYSLQTVGIDLVLLTKMREENFARNFRFTRSKKLKYAVLILKGCKHKTPLNGGKQKIYPYKYLRRILIPKRVISVIPTYNYIHYT